MKQYKIACPIISGYQVYIIEAETIENAKENVFNYEDIEIYGMDEIEIDNDPDLMIVEEF